MTSTISKRTVSIPETDNCVNASAQELMQRFPVKVATYGLTFDGSCSEETKYEVCAYLIAADKEQALRSRFRMGDAYNAISGEYGAKRRFICERFGEQYYNFFRVCGSVAKKWDLPLRNNQHTWDWYRRNHPDKLPKGRIYAPQRLTLISRENTPEGEVILYEAPDGRPFTALTEEQKRLKEERAVYSAKA